jgi:hypothetical protein
MLCAVLLTLHAIGGAARAADDQLQAFATSGQNACPVPCGSTIRGRVVVSSPSDGLHGFAPHEAVRVGLQGGAATLARTNADGFFVLRNVPLGIWTIAVTAPEISGCSVGPAFAQRVNIKTTGQPGNVVDVGDIELLC